MERQVVSRRAPGHGQVEVDIDPRSVAWRALPQELLGGVAVDRVRLETQRSEGSGLLRFWAYGRAVSGIGIDLADPSFRLALRDRDGRIVGGGALGVERPRRALPAGATRRLSGGTFREGVTSGVAGAEAAWQLLPADIPAGLMHSGPEHDR